MMDYAGRVEQADTYPKLLRLNARDYGGEIALREKDFGLWKLFTWNDYQTRVHDFALGLIFPVEHKFLFIALMIVKNGIFQLDSRG